MTRQEINKAFAEKVKQLCPKAKDVSMCGYSLVVTFRGEKSAMDAAVLLSSVVSDVRVYESRDDLELAAIFDCEFDLDKIEAASNEQLIAMIIDWIEQGNECA